jgi:pyruvate dehydrogenase E1 component alpha subunit
LIALGASAPDIDRIDAEARAEIAAAQRFAEASPPPEASAAFTDVQTVGGDAWR